MRDTGGGWEGGAGVGGDGRGDVGVGGRGDVGVDGGVDGGPTRHVAGVGEEKKQALLKDEDDILVMYEKINWEYIKLVLIYFHW